jgi:alkylation response protein AidB-like acyl-CoA dehydrogenase
MSSYISTDTLRFLLFEAHPIGELLAAPRFSHLDESSIELMVQAAKDWADAELFPAFREMDEKPAYWHDGRVHTHPLVGKVLRQGGENGWIGGRDDFDKGGLQMPEMVHAAIHEIFEAANNSAQGYLGLTTGSARLITTFGSQELCETYVPKMYAGEWQGTMALTEPQAGSSLSDITTSARPADEGWYKIKGQKIFISGGDHSGAENFVHLTLARIEGAPPGVKGISLFVIPRLRPEADGSLTYNDVKTAADFQKLGQRGYSNTHLVYGEEDNCRGWLVGEPHKGLSYMFQMMNEARIGVGHSAAATASAAYHASLQYAQERPQGRPPGNRNPLDPPIPIIHHADVQRMLLTQQVIVDGALSLAAFCCKLMDRMHVSEDGSEKNDLLLLLEILTPVVKAYSTEQGIRSVSLGMQVLGGYGYTMDFPLQQYYRDIRIMAIYEGTTGIQSLDLLGRKVTMENGRAFQLLIKEMQKTAEKAAGVPHLSAFAATLTTEIERLTAVTRHLLGFAKAGELEKFTADATVYMEMTGNIVVAWQWLHMALEASARLETGGRLKPEFYETALRSLRFYYRYELPHAEANARTIRDGVMEYALPGAVLAV